jgi:Domain of unknown function (DUF4386)
MTLERVTGLLLIVMPIAFNLFFFLLGRGFDYPNILRQPTEEILRRFQAGGTALKLTWHGFFLTAVAFVPLVILVGQVLAEEDLAVVPLATTFGVLAAAVQFLGLIRWPYLVPYLARTFLDPSSSEATRDAVSVVFQSFHRTLGIGVGEHLGYLFTGLWTLLVGVAMTQADVFPSWLGWPGIVLGLVLIGGSFEFAGSFEEAGWKLAGILVPIAYIVWSLWLVVAGVTLVLR